MINKQCLLNVKGTRHIRELMCCPYALLEGYTMTSPNTSQAIHSTYLLKTFTTVEHQGIFYKLLNT